MLTSVQEDYLEAIHGIERAEGDVRITWLAARLGRKLPTVTRTIQKLTSAGLVAHESRGTVHLTRSGRATAEQLVRRRFDLERFLHSVLGLPPESAESDACRLEHGLSPLAATRLRQWLDHLDRFDAESRDGVIRFAGRDGSTPPDLNPSPDLVATEWKG